MALSCIPFIVAGCFCPGYHFFEIRIYYSWKIESVSHKEISYRKTGRKKGLLYFEEAQNVDHVRLHGNKNFLHAYTIEDLPYQRLEYKEGQKITLKHNSLIYKNKNPDNFQLEELIRSHPDPSKLF
jgi:hypothetical protein